MSEKVYQVFGIDGYAAASRVLFGLECEIEALQNIPENVKAKWKVVEDGSLRNSGYEFLNKPANKQEALQLFNHLHATLVYGDKAFSDRTSTHVHVNCQPLGLEQVKNIILMYALFEEVFFSIIDPRRRSNIHCVPLTETFLVNHYHQPLLSMMDRWHKYTALNIKPLGTLGTIEFRHLQGTNDQQLVSEWLTILESLVKLGSQEMITPDKLTDDNISSWFSILFEGTRAYALKPMVKQLTQQQLLDVKLAFI